MWERFRWLPALVAASTVVAGGLPTAATAAAASESPLGERLYLVTLDGPGTSGGTSGVDAARLRAEQDAVLERVETDQPVYRWTTALNGFAVELTRFEAARLAVAPGVARVEPSRVRPVAGTDVAAAAAPALRPGDPESPGGSQGSGGEGVVIGFVDTGIHPDSPVFAGTGRLGRRPDGFTGSCPAVDGWTGGDCSAKVLGARHYLAGFGADRLSASASQSPYDDDGHGSEVASVAAGNADVSALSGGEDLGRFSGVAPRARIAVYKACWSAPDPDDDGCSTADVVAAIDQATADGVDVLSVAVTGSSDLDTVDLALLGAAEADVAVVAAAGNDLPRAGNAQPWVTTVGGTTGPARPGELRLTDGTVMPGVTTGGRPVGPARVVRGEQIPAPGSSREDARLCVPGSLDAARAADSIVVCERGRVARVDKSSAVDLADGLGMVLTNTQPQDLSADLHAVPTLHVAVGTAETLRARLRDGVVRARLVPTDASSTRPRVLGSSAGGDPGGAALKPDLVAAGAGLLAASSPETGARWALTSGTSAATAQVAGLTARLRSDRPQWSAARVRSALMTSAGRVPSDVPTLRQGAGAPRAGATAPGLVLDVPSGAYRRALEAGEPGRLNLPSVLADIGSRPVTLTRRVTSTADRPTYFSSGASGFDRHRVTVTPEAVRIAPGETRTFRVRVTPTGRAGDTDSGWVTWRGADGTRVRLPVALR
ncbi:S8 family serine peptidase [Nocardioides donggukensis]|uniref:S8 family serine peptidase n=1 Tax=Nocardioides donggukensis TaxID=2774019 RepID=A0A927Q0I4_9ACTN|nr:S8 family serine peptidase [Nocardioides donggukensis]MBD8868469.1 S8 family serine peptidase [Nocardioides donggukensis]